VSESQSTSGLSIDSEMYSFASGTIVSARTSSPSKPGTQPVSSNISLAVSRRALTSLVVALLMTGLLVSVHYTKGIDAELLGDLRAGEKLRDARKTSRLEFNVQFLRALFELLLIQDSLIGGENLRPWAEIDSLGIQHVGLAIGRGQ